jgi:hypothetical protein
LCDAVAFIEKKSRGCGKGIPINVPARQYVYQDNKLRELNVNIRILNYGAPVACRSAAASAVTFRSTDAETWP